MPDKVSSNQKTNLKKCKINETRKEGLKIMLTWQPML